jgi:hypothetical protein
VVPKWYRGPKGNTNRVYRFHPANGIYLICAALANHTIDVLVICDPPTRHHSKRAHHQQVGKKEKIRLQLMLHRMKLARFRDDNGMIEQVTREIRKLEKADCRMLENICKGCDGNEYFFLAPEGVSSCNVCKASICRFCTWNDSNENNTPPVCFECKRYNIACEDEQPTEQEMRQHLKEHAVNDPAVVMLMCSNFFNNTTMTHMTSLQKTFSTFVTQYSPLHH